MQKRLRVKLDTILGIIIRSGGDISQTEISNQCKDFFGYNNEQSHRVSMSKMLKMLEAEGVIEKRVEGVGTGSISSNFWYIVKERLKECPKNVVHTIPSELPQTEW